MQDPLPNLEKQNLSFHCAVHREKSATLDTGTVRKVNWEIFVLSDGEAAAEFDSNPLKYCGIVTDPVTRQRFIPDEHSPSLIFDRRLYYFWTEESKLAFEKLPGMYNNPNYRMKELGKDESL